MIVLTAVVAAVLAASPVAEEPHSITITNVTLSANGVGVMWTSDVPPPYRAAVHVPRAARLGLGTPVEYVDTDDTSAVIPVDIGHASVFVQVYKPDDPTVCAREQKRMIRTVWELYKRREAASPMTTITDVKACGSQPGVTNASQAVLIKCGFKSPDGSETLWRDAKSWDAVEIMTPTEDGVPYAAYEKESR